MLRLFGDAGLGNAGPLFVVFSHVDVPQGSFAQSKVMRALGADALFINPLKNDWYAGPIAGLSDTLEGLASALNQLSQSSGRQLCFVGHSMGAYAALTMASNIDGCTYLATSPEPVVGMRGSRSWKNGLRRWHAFTKSLRDPHIERAKGAVIWGWQDPMDAYFLASNKSFSGRYGDIFWVDHHHGITEYLNHEKAYLEILRDASGGRLSKQTSKLVNPHSTLTDRNLMQSFYRLHVRFENCRRANMRPDPKTISSAIALEQWQNAGAQHLLSIIFKDSGDLEKAQELALKAAHLSPSNHEYIANCGRLAMKRNDSATLIALLKGIAAKNISHKAYERFMAEVDLFLAEGDRLNAGRAI